MDKAASVVLDGANSVFSSEAARQRCVDVRMLQRESVTGDAMITQASGTSAGTDMDSRIRGRVGAATDLRVSEIDAAARSCFKVCLPEECT